MDEPQRLGILAQSQLQNYIGMSDKEDFTGLLNDIDAELPKMRLYPPLDLIKSCDQPRTEWQVRSGTL